MRIMALALAGILFVSGAQAGALVLEEKTESEGSQSEARRLRDSTRAPNSVLGDVGVEIGKTIAEGMDSSRIRGAVVVTTLPQYYSGRCDKKTFGDARRYDVKFTNAEYGIVTLSCNDKCWHVMVTPGGRTGTNCGEFQHGSWSTTSGNMNQYNARLVDVVNFINNF